MSLAITRLRPARLAAYRRLSACSMNWFGPCTAHGSLTSAEMLVPLFSHVVG